MFSLVLVLLACSGPTPEPIPAPVPEAAEAPAPAPARPAGPAGSAIERTWQAELDYVDHRLTFFEARIAANGNDSAAVGQAVGLLLDRGQLTGDYADYARAQAHLDASFALQGAAAAGPHPAAVSLDLALHRYDAAQARLPFLRASTETQASLDFERGNYQAAGEVFERLAKSNQPVHLSRLAIFKWKTGDFDEAERLLDEAERRYHGRFHRPEAWYHLHRGIFDLERTRYDDALVHYAAASEKLANYWLIDEHVAEIYLLKGELDKAHELYTDLVARTGNPEFMDALAETLERQGKPDEAKAMAAKARTAYDVRLRQFPEATWGHALDHWLRWGDPAEALEMAEKNHKNRPNGDAKLALARALANVGRLDDARQIVAEVQSSPFNTPEVAELAAELKAR